MLSSPALVRPKLPCSNSSSSLWSHHFLFGASRFLIRIWKLFFRVLVNKHFYLCVILPIGLFSALQSRVNNWIKDRRNRLPAKSGHVVCIRFVKTVYSKTTFVQYPSWIQDLIISSQQQPDQQKPQQSFNNSSSSQRTATTATLPSGQRLVNTSKFCGIAYCVLRISLLLNNAKQLHKNAQANEFSY